MASLPELPSDILYNIFPYLGATDFLSLTSSTKALLSYSKDPKYWRVLTRRTFRIPPQPLLQADGARWQWLYKNLRTKTRLFTWGNNSRGNLGRTTDSNFMKVDNAWPGCVTTGDDIGVIADVQCGGWSTYLLNSFGMIFIFGIFNGMLHSNSRFERRLLKFPEKFEPNTPSRHEPSTAIQQFSAGRCHILGLADNRNVWCWTSEVSCLVWPAEVGMLGGGVIRVVAGWDRSSAYVDGIGIVYWDPPNPTHEVTSYHVNKFLIPSTGYRRQRDDRDLDTIESRIGEVTNHIVLEGYIVFITDNNKIFSYETTNTVPFEPGIFPGERPEPIELSAFYPDDPQSPFHIRDLQGSFRSFAVFTESGSVLTASCTFLAIHSHTESPQPDPSSPLPSPNTVPGLQGKSVICIAFGDHHFHALHSNGTISSYGIECQSCGALGLGSGSIARLRGLRRTRARWSRDSNLKELEGRTVWFEPMMNDWLKDISRKSAEEEAVERASMITAGHEGACDAMADYFEHEGQKWEEGITDEGELGTYFVLRVSAAGWHSAALVLVDEDKAERARRKHIVVSKSEELPVEYTETAASSQPAASCTRDRVAELLVRSVRWFLGLTARDARMRSTANDRNVRQDEHEVHRGNDDSNLYTWSNDPFPRLRMVNGEVMPGEIEITE